MRYRHAALEVKVCVYVSPVLQEKDMNHIGHTYKATQLYGQYPHTSTAGVQQASPRAEGSRQHIPHTWP